MICNPANNPSPGETPLEAPAGARAEHRVRRRIWGTAAEVILLTVLIVFALVRPFILEPFYIPSASMAPLLMPNDRILVNKLAYTLGEPSRGDVIVFYGSEESGHPDEIYIKRIIGMPGERIAVHDGKTYIEEMPLEEGYLHSSPYQDSGTVIVPPGSYFVMGDNRNDSRDSRYWGAVPRDRIIGKAELVFWPLSRSGRVK